MYQILLKKKIEDCTQKRTYILHSYIGME